MIMENIEGNIEKLRAIRDLGISIAIDDFGTGYSSLGYLARLPVNALKIDRSFIIAMDKGPDSMAIVSTIISLAHSLKLKVVAEGVDSEGQSRLLNLLKCDEIQGYLFSKPLPADILLRFLQEKTDLR
jgi:EAL domain-containing protein (putative c-di-GMP-specific phosphodiesterase class I)